jgi:hypothetical protein
MPHPEPNRAETAQEADIFAKIERLADLQQKGILSADNSARFGGDPNRIILIGHSAGATHVAGTEIDIRD